MRKLTALLLTAIMLFGTVAAPVTVLAAGGAENYPLNSVVIKVEDIVTHSMLGGARFEIYYSNDAQSGGYGTLVATVDSDGSGVIVLSGIPSGYYIVRQTIPPNNYHLSMGGLLIVKTDKNTGKPLAGVVFDVRSADGSAVAGSILDGNQPDTAANSPNGGDIAGSYITDAGGRIQINGLDAGLYHVTERKALDGYELDTTVHSVTVTPGKLAALQLTNTPKAGLRIIKIDSVTKKPIFGVEFMLFDANNIVVGTYRTDNNGVIDFTGIIPEGRYTIRETKAAAGYYLDDEPKTVEFTSGRVTEIRWENTPQMGQIQIMKKSGDDNEVNGLPAGTPLAGAVFEAYDHRTGNLIDRFISGSDGRAVSKPLPLGRYVVKEVQAPQWYKVSDRQLDIELEFATQIIKLEYLNYSANTGVYIKKTGNAEAMSGDVIPYTIKAVQNTGSVPLTDFYWRDMLPANAARLTKIVTGTYNQALKYKVIATTNKGDTLIIADNLSTTKNHAIDCSNVSLGLRNDEYVTAVTFVFGTVKAGFSQVVCPQLYMKVLPNLPNGFQFANKCDVGGKYGSEWVVSNSTCVTAIYAVPGKLPRTGY